MKYVRDQLIGKVGFIVEGTENATADIADIQFTDGYRERMSLYNFVETTEEEWKVAQVLES